MRPLLIALLLLVAFAALASCQMFQYSRGWRPGKRADESAATTVDVPALVRCLQLVGAAPETPEVGRAASHLLEALERCQGGGEAGY